MAKKPDKKRKKGEARTKQGQARLDAARRQIEASRRRSMGGRAAPFGAPQAGARRPEIPEEAEERPEEKREEARRERTPEKKEEKDKDKDKEEEPKEESEEADETKAKEGKEGPEGAKPGEEAEGEGKALKPPAETPVDAVTKGGEAAKTGGEVAKAGGEVAEGAGTAAGGGAAAAGGAAGGVAAAEAETGAATGGTSCLVQIIAAVIIGIIIILLVVIIAFILSQIDGAGRTPKEEPNQNSQADMIDRGKAIANANGGVNSLVQAEGMAGDNSFNTAKDKINDSAKNYPNLPNKEALNKMAEELSLNLEVLQSQAADDLYVAKQTKKITALTDKLKSETESCRETDEQCGLINQNAEKIDYAINEIKAYTFTKEETSLLGKEELVKIRPGMEINSLDLQYIKDNKVDIRILRLINHLGEAGWDKLKISRIVDFDQTDNESNVDNEDEATVSAHNSGQALDITIVGTYHCSKHWGLTDFRRPCYVYYQTGFRPNSSTSYGGPNGDSFDEIFANFAFGQASELLNGGSINAENWADFLVQAGISVLIEETGLTPTIFEFPTYDSGLGAYALGESLGVDPNVFERMLGAKNNDEAWTKLGASILAQSLNLPSGAFEGSTTDEILQNTAKAYLRKSLGIERTGEISDFGPQNLGAALIEKYLLTRDPDQVKERLRLSDNIFLKSLNLTPDITANYLSGTSDFNQFAAAVGNNQLAKLNKTYQGAGLERALGIPAGSWTGVSSNNDDILKRVGAAILARYISMDEESAYQNPNNFVNNIGKEAVVNITTIKQTEFANLIKGQDSPKKLTAVADNYMANKNSSDLNFAVRDGLLKNNLSSTKLAGGNFKSIFGPEILKDILFVTTNSLLERSVYSYQANFGDYTMSPGDIERIRLGDLSSVAYKIAGGIFDQELNLPIGFTQALIENREPAKDIMAKAGISLLAQALGINIQDQVLNQSWFEPNVIPSRLAQIKLESFGFKDNTFAGSIESVIAANGIKAVASALGLSEEELGRVRVQGPDDYIKSKLYAIDAALGIPNGTSLNFALGAVSAEGVVSSLAESLKETIKTSGIQGLATKLGLDASHLPAGDLLAAFMGQDLGALVNFFSSLTDSAINQDLLTSVNFFSQLVSTNGLDLKIIVANEGIKIFSQVINNSAATQIASIFVNQYLNGEPISVSELLKSSTGITNTEDAKAFLLGQAKSALAYWGVGQLTNAVNQVFGPVGLTYEQARAVFSSDPEARAAAGKSIGYAYLDLGLNRLDPSIPYGAARILIEGNDEDRRQFALSYLASKIEVGGITLTGADLNKIIKYFETGDFDELGPSVYALADNALGLPSGTVETIQYFIQNNGAIGFEVSDVSGWAEASFENWFQDQTGFDLGAIVNIQQSITSGQLVFTGDPETMIINFAANWLIGKIGSSIDSALGVPGLTNALLIGIFTGNWTQLAFALLSSFFATRCQDPVKITREHVRLVLGQSLNAPDTPSQIATFRQEDVNYYSGLRDDGEIDLRLRNVLYEKYGPVSMRVYKGMFTLPWSFDHIHIGY